MIEYQTCIIKDGLTDVEIFETIFNSSAYYIMDARLNPDKPLDVIYNEQRNIYLSRGFTTPVPAGRRRPKPIKI